MSTPKMMSERRMRPPITPPAIAPVWDCAERFDEGVLALTAWPVTTDTEGEDTLAFEEPASTVGTAVLDVLDAPVRSIPLPAGGGRDDD